MNKQCSPKISLPDNGDARFCFDVLSEKLGKHDLLGEKLRPDGDLRLGRSATARRDTKEAKEAEQMKEPERKAAHFYKTFNLRSISPKRKSASNASKAAGIAPARMSESLTSATPRKIKVPRPPAPMAAAMVAT